MGTQEGIQVLLAVGLYLFAVLVPVTLQIPLLGGKAMPASVRIGLALMLTVFLMLTLPELTVAMMGLLKGHKFLPLMSLLMLYGIGHGVMLALVMRLPLTIFHMTGQFADLFRGSTLANTLNPHLNFQVSPSAQILYQLATCIAFLKYVHLYLIEFLALTSIDLLGCTLPTIGNFEFSGEKVALILTLTEAALRSAVLLVLPVLVSVFLADLLLAVMNKAAPQVNVFFLGMPLKATLGLLILALTLDPLGTEVMILYNKYFRQGRLLFQCMDTKTSGSYKTSTLEPPKLSFTSGSLP